MTMQSAALFWNDVALEANKEDHTNRPQDAGGPTYSARALALAHAAMADAFTNAHCAGGGRAPFLAAFTSTVPSGPALPAAAVAGAAHAVLSAIHKRQRPFFDASLATFVAQLGGGTPAVQGGLAFGQQVASAILDRAASDGSQDPTNSNDRSGYVPGGLNGMHAPDPLNPGQGYYGWHYGNVRPMALERRDALAALPPPPPQTHEKRYLKDYVEVYRVGRKPQPGKRPTDEQVRIGIFWAYDGVKGIGTPPRLYNQILREVGEADGLSEAEWVVLLAQANIAMSDAGIVAWQAKYLYNVWRPIVGIRQHVEISGRSDEQQDPTWEPLGAPASNGSNNGKDFTPPFPAYPSGHATFGAACFTALKRFRQQRNHRADPDRIDIKFVSDELNGITTDADGVTVRPRIEQHFRSIDAMIEANLVSRVLLGVHWRFDGDGGKESGAKVGQQVADTLYRKR